MTDQTEQLTESRPYRESKPQRRNKASSSPEDIIVNRRCAQLVDLYCRVVRPHSTSERRGVIRAMRRLMDQRDISFGMLQLAVDNYAKDPFTVDSDRRCRKNIRSFFVEHNILDWQRAIQRSRITPTPRRDVQLDILDRLDQLA